MICENVDHDPGQDHLRHEQVAGVPKKVLNTEKIHGLFADFEFTDIRVALAETIRYYRSFSRLGEIIIPDGAGFQPAVPGILPGTRGARSGGAGRGSDGPRTREIRQDAGFDRLEACSTHI